MYGFENFVKQYPNSKYLNFKYSFVNPDKEKYPNYIGNPYEVRNRIYDYCLKENSLVLWEKALSSLNKLGLSEESGNTAYDKSLQANKEMYDNLNKYKNTSVIKDKSDITIAYKEVQKLYSEIEKKENKQWKDEEFAWESVSNSNTIETCKRYLELHPNGKHKKEVIDLQVALVLQGDYGQLPSMSVINGKSSAQSTIKISNSTQYKLTVLYSGPTSENVIILPGDSKHIQLKSGAYKISAFVDNYKIRNFAGTEVINMNNYSVEYYIETTRFKKR